MIGTWDDPVESGTTQPNWDNPQPLTGRPRLTPARHRWARSRVAAVRWRRVPAGWDVGAGLLRVFSGRGLS